jgi:hypothetical protein
MLLELFFGLIFLILSWMIWNKYQKYFKFKGTIPGKNLKQIPMKPFNYGLGQTIELFDRVKFPEFLKSNTESISVITSFQDSSFSFKIFFNKFQSLKLLIQKSSKKFVL